MISRRCSARDGRTTRRPQGEAAGDCRRHRQQAGDPGQPRPSTDRHRLHWRRHAGGERPLRSRPARGRCRRRSASGPRDPWRGSACDDVSRAGGVSGCSVRHRRRVAFEDRGDQARLALALEGAAPGRHLVERPRRTRRCRCARRRPCLRAARAPCTGTCRESCPRPVSGPLRRGGQTVRRRGRARLAFARPKSSSLTPAFVSITLPGFRSRWTMPCAVRLVERVGDLRRDTAAPARAAAVPREPLRERLALEVLHDEERRRRPRWPTS